MRAQHCPLGVHSLEIRLTYEQIVRDHHQEFRCVEGGIQRQEWLGMPGGARDGNPRDNACG